MAAFVLQFACIGTARAQSFSILHQFNNTNGGSPYGQLVVDGSTIYGTTLGGGASSRGTIFKLNTDGTNHSIMHTFDIGVTNGWGGSSGLTLSGSTLYGTTSLGGANGHGTVYSISTAGTGFSILHSIDGTSGPSFPSELSLNGSTLFGVTYSAGANDRGMLYSVSTNGTGYTNLHSFGPAAAGMAPRSKPIISGTKIYGTTSQGGNPSNSSGGTIYSSDLDGGNFTILRSLQIASPDGTSPYVSGGLRLIGSTLYGTAPVTGSSLSQSGTLYALNTDGSNFRVLHAFTGGTDGDGPVAGLAQNGNILYGTTTYGGGLGTGSGGSGTIFQINTDGTGYQILHRFDGTDGLTPYGMLTYSNGTLYGTTTEGGSSNRGVVFALAVPEPSSAIMLILGTVGAAVVWRRKARAS